ncbi:nuclear transport factor 2 family protein [Streptomyces sp. NPDC005962]|uniref:nuclear transport factor 2 family protein n=1 Tax=Streptomyces sp. NPDC005962 TaxID=3154466 RepID=UPI00340D5BE7
MNHLADRAAIHDLNTRYAVAFDSFRSDESSGCWAEDGVLDERETGFGLFQGRDAVRAFFRDSRLLPGESREKRRRLCPLPRQIRGRIRSRGRAVEVWQSCHQVVLPGCPVPGVTGTPPRSGSIRSGEAFTSHLSREAHEARPVQAHALRKAG